MKEMAAKVISISGEDLDVVRSDPHYRGCIALIGDMENTFYRVSVTRSSTPEELLVLRKELSDGLVRFGRVAAQALIDYIRPWTEATAKPPQPQRLYFLKYAVLGTMVGMPTVTPQQMHEVCRLMNNIFEKYEASIMGMGQ